MKKFILLFAIVTTFSAMGQETQVPLVQVVGEGKVTVVPDKVIIKARMEHQGKSAAEVKQQNDQAVSKVIAYLKSEGIPARNIQTEYIRLNKEYDYNTKENFFSANQAISIRLDDLKKYEKIMTGLLNSGLNRIDGIEFKTSQEEKLQSEARKKAVLNAKMKAEEFVSALGQRIGPAVMITEVDGNQYQPVYRVMKMESADSSQGETIAPGEMEVIVKVNVGFKIQA